MKRAALFLVALMLLGNVAHAQRLKSWQWGPDTLVVSANQDTNTCVFQSASGRGKGLPERLESTYVLTSVAGAKDSLWLWAKPFLYDNAGAKVYLGPADTLAYKTAAAWSDTTWTWILSGLYGPVNGIDFISKFGCSAGDTLILQQYGRGR